VNTKITFRVTQTTKIYRTAMTLPYVVTSHTAYFKISLGIFIVVPPTEPCALKSTQPLIVSTRDFF